MAIGFPAIMANLATPVGSAYAVRIFSDVGEAAGRRRRRSSTG